MNGKEILELGRMAKARSDERLIKNHPEIVKVVRAESAAKIADLEKSNAEQAARIKAFEADIEQMNAKVAELTKANAALEAERDNWRKQALEENAEQPSGATQPKAADVAADKGKGAKRTRKGK